MINQGRVLLCNSVFAEDPWKLKEAHLFSHNNLQVDRENSEDKHKRENLN